MKKSKYDFEAELINQREDDVIFLEEQAAKLDRIFKILEERANFFYEDSKDLTSKNYERGFFDGIHLSRNEVNIAVATALRERANTEKQMLLGDKKVKVKNG